MPILSNTTPYYGGGQVPNPANVIQTSGSPSTKLIELGLGTLAVDNATGTMYGLVSKTSGSATWTVLGGGTGAIATITGDSGGALSPTGGNLNILGTANQIATTGSGSTLTLSLVGPYTPTTYTSHGVLIGASTSSIVATSAGTTGQVLTATTSADPAFAALGTNSGLTAHGVLIGENNSAIAATSAGTTGQVLTATTSADPAFAALGTNSGLTQHGVLIGENNSAIAATAAGTTGQVLIGATSADPAFGNLGVNSGLTGLILGNTNSAFTTATFTPATAFTPAFSLATAGDSAWTYSSRVGRYMQLGNLVFFNAQLVWSAFANTTGSGNWQLNIPVTSGAFNSTGQIIISGSGIDANAETANLPANFTGVIGSAANIVVLAVEEGGITNSANALFNLTVTQVLSAGTMNVSGWYFAS